MNAFREKLLSIQLAPSAMPSRRRKYYDRESVETIFSPNAEEEVRESSGGFSPSEIQNFTDAETAAWLRSRPEVDDG